MFGRWGAAIVAAMVVAGGAALWIADSGGAATGALTPKGCVDDNDTGTDNCGPSTNGLARVNTLAISPDGKSVYAASETDDAIVRFKRDRRSGALRRRGASTARLRHRPQSGRGRSAPGAPTASRRRRDRAEAERQIGLRRGEEDDAIVRFKRNCRSGALRPRGCIDDNDFGTDPNQGEDDCATSTNGLAGVTSLAVSEDGKSLYAVGAEDDAIVRFKRNTRNGALTPKGCIDDNDTSLGQGPDECAQSTNGLSEPGQLVLSADGRSLYVPGEEDDAIVRFKRNRRSGALRPRGCIDDNDFGTDPNQGEDTCTRSVNGLNTVESVALSPGGKSLYAVARRRCHRPLQAQPPHRRPAAEGVHRDNDSAPTLPGRGSPVRRPTA